ncbi:calcitonin gene-related peptide type 1 receptor-like, partial [Hyalella azteca]|uniref:Calcitonin gene-related peptide type 1 receptor-like n=1 Tax=Hyalella azteca TaxID=294128 RepID=A0A979FXZ9_HYAAZ
AGHVAAVACPAFITGFDPELKGERICWPNATWFSHPETGRPWTNYTKCVNLYSMELHQFVNLVYVVGYAASIAAIVVSLCIFFYFKSLKCTRVSIHKNLFVSFLVNNVLWLVWTTVVTSNTRVLLLNPVWCQLLHVLMHYFLVSTYFWMLYVLMHYFLVSTYFWMLCEGLYLHTILVVTFVAEGRLLRFFLLLGWIFPVPPTALYATFRSLDVHAVRATLILVPLLGLHYLLTPFRPSSGSAMEKSYLILSAIVSSFQGLAVSLLFCFFNGEVVAVLRKKWRQRRLMTAPLCIYDPRPTYYKASLADGLTQVTAFNAAGDEDDVWPSLSPRPSPCASPSPQAYGGHKPHDPNKN